MMVFKVQKLEPNVHLIRGYSPKDDIKFCFVCTLYKATDKKQWEILAALSVGMGIKAIGETFKYLKTYPDGVYTHVTVNDWQRFYKRFCKKIKFDDCGF